LEERKKNKDLFMIGKFFKNANKINLIVILVWPIFATLLSFLFNANYLISILLFFGVPSIYLSVINQKFVIKIALYSFIFSVPVAIILDYIAVVSGTWFMPLSVFDPFRVFGLIVVENILWVYLWVYFITIFYETFIEKDCKIKSFYPRLKYLFVVLISLTFGIVLTHFINPTILKINFAYLKVGIILTIVPIFFAYFKFPKIYTKLLKVGMYFFTLSFLHEITGLALNQWVFTLTGTFIGWIKLGGIQFPIEEFVFFMILGSMSIISFYEIFDDDGK